MLQAYCSYAWPTIQHAVLARWEAEKKSETFDDGDDPLPDDDDAPLAGRHIPLSQGAKPHILDGKTVLKWFRKEQKLFAFSHCWLLY